MNYLSSDLIYTPEGWQKDAMLSVDEQGYIQGWHAYDASRNPTHYRGYLVPGWVNAHCHLELSALHGRIPESTGMTGFIRHLFQVRGRFDQSQQEEAAGRALKNMQQQGVVAIGDISNLPLTANVKRQFQTACYTHTFVEILGLRPSEVEARWQQGQEVAQAFSGLPHSIVPHAPYSTSSALFKRIYQSESRRFSLHLMESVEEIALFATNTGPFPRFYHELGLEYPPFGTHDPVTHATRDLADSRPMIWVHNTELAVAKLIELHQRFSQSWCCLCPRANWYIHRRLPDVMAFASATDRICLGTDSLASNHSLDIWGEIQFLKAQFAELDWHQLIRWGTTGGAQALGIDDKCGAFTPETAPGILHIDSLEKQGTTRKLYPAHFDI